MPPKRDDHREGRARVLEEGGTGSGLGVGHEDLDRRRGEQGFTSFGQDT